MTEDKDPEEDFVVGGLYGSEGVNSTPPTGDDHSFRVVEVNKEEDELVVESVIVNGRKVRSPSQDTVSYERYLGWLNNAKSGLTFLYED